jgi:hypothetical protein
MKNNYTIKGSVVEIEIVKKGKDAGVFTCLMDLEDFVRFQNELDVSMVYQRGYVAFRKMIDGKRKSFYLHRWVMGEPESLVVDHKKGNKMDNRKEMLRVCTQRENTRNKVSNNPYRNVHLNSQGYYHVRLFDGGKEIAGGKTFKCREKARERAEELRREIYGEFAGRFEA